MLTKLMVACAVLLGGVDPPVQWLPDLIVDPAAFSDRIEDSNVVPGRVMMRFRSSIPNIGLGEFRIVATGELADDGFHQKVEQHVPYSDGSVVTIPLDDDYLYNPISLRMDVRWWTRYYIRELLPDDGVGQIVAHGAKPEINVTSSTSYDLTLPNAPSAGNQLRGAGPIQGISVGWTDIYPKSLLKQWVDVSHLPPGDYWLEMQVDVSNKILESNPDNNMARTIITLSHPNLPPFRTHMADTDIDMSINLSELLRVIQLYTFFEYHCLAHTGDGYFPGPGDDYNCLPHSADFKPQDWHISLSELLRSVQIYSLGGYTECPDGEDGYCAVSTK